MMRRLLAVMSLVSSIAFPIASAAGQGALSTQGFGFPPGQFSTRVLATGGGMAQFDPDTPLNPAAIALSSDPRMFLQYEPEFRKVTLGSAQSTTLTSRFPVGAASVPVGTHATVGVAISTLLDRSSTTLTSHDQQVGGEVVTITESTKILGAINDVRLAAAYGFGPKFQIGIAGHVFTGQNRVIFTQTFPDTLNFTNISQTSTLGFTGFAASAGVLIRPSRNIGFGFSGQKGARIEAKTSDSVVSKADIPDRLSAGVSFEGIPGTSLSAHASRSLWSRMNGLGSSDATAIDTWEAGGGIESLGPRVLSRQTVLRVGARYRTLPFTADGNEVKELSFAGGVGAQFFRNRATFDVSLERAARSTNGTTEGARERAYVLSFGLRVRP
ncbi:MAG: hypothetical protein ABI556_08155 [Gemmatimonadales bacterium]